MQIKNYGETVIQIISDEIIKNEQDFLNIMATHESDTYIFKKENFSDDFYKLATGIAGKILQKASTYRKKIVIIGDFQNVDSNALRDFIYECNKMKQVIFTETIDKALEVLKIKK